MQKTANLYSLDCGLASALQFIGSFSKTEAVKLFQLLGQHFNAAGKLALKPRDSFILQIGCQVALQQHTKPPLSLTNQATHLCRPTFTYATRKKILNSK